jgi:hypothetical protein
MMDMMMPRGAVRRSQNTLERVLAMSSTKYLM